MKTKKKIKICPYCDQKNKENEKFCDNCGKPIQEPNLICFDTEGVGNDWTGKW